MPDLREKGNIESTEDVHRTFHETYEPEADRSPQPKKSDIFSRTFGSTNQHFERTNEGAAAPPFDYNPSAWSQRVPICLLAGVPFLMATYMALYQWRLISDVWDPLFGDGTRRVLDSEMSENIRRYIRVPDAALGAFGYLSEVVLGFVGTTRRWQDRPWMVLLFGIDVIPLGIVSAVLVIMQGTAVGAWCALCLMTAVISLIWSCLLTMRSGRRLPTSLGSGSELGIKAILGCFLGACRTGNRCNRHCRNKMS